RPGTSPPLRYRHPPRCPAGPAGGRLRQVGPLRTPQRTRPRTGGVDPHGGRTLGDRGGLHPTRRGRGRSHRACPAYPKEGPTGVCLCRSPSRPGRCHGSDPATVTEVPDPRTDPTRRPTLRRVSQREGGRAGPPLKAAVPPGPGPGEDLLPAGRHRAPFVVAGGALHTHHGTLVELREGTGPGVGQRAAHPGDDLVDEILHTGPLRVQVHAPGGDALLEQGLTSPVER